VDDDNIRALATQAGHSVTTSILRELRSADSNSRLRVAIFHPISEVNEGDLIIWRTEATLVGATREETLRLSNQRAMSKDMVALYGDSGAPVVKLEKDRLVTELSAAVLKQIYGIWDE